MANKKTGWGILVMALVFGMMVSGCDNGSTKPPEEKPPEEKTTVERSGNWVDPESDVTLDYSVANDGVCTITVGGTPDIYWKANYSYAYTGKKDTNYTYTFEAWTQSGNRDINVQYYCDNDDAVYMGKFVSITPERKTYTIVGKPLLKENMWYVEFQCADQLGTFYIKMLSITEGGDYDYIKIQSVTPSTGLTDGVEQAFTVEVEYCLASQAQGVIYIYFNDLYKPNIWNFFEYITVNKGKGKHTFNVTALTKDWKKLGYKDEFQVGVDLGFYLPFYGEYVYLEGEFKALSFK